MHCGIKHRSPDLGAIAFAAPVPWAGVFTQNAAAAAPVQWCRARAGRPARAIVVNSGNANACTGPDGDKAVSEVVSEAAGRLGCSEEEVLMASTGPIGVPLPTGPIIDSIPQLFDGLEEDVEGFARSIMTTDTKIKVAEARAGDAVVRGVAKGAAMIAPNMATMLAFLVTDATASSESLSDVLGPAVDRSFNRISIDGCESTNDSVFLFSTGVASCSDEELGSAVAAVCADLAEQIVRDAEGGTKLMRIHVSGAHDERHAADLGRAVAYSDLWRAAVHGEDPNWGRVVSAMGAADRSLNLGDVRVSIGGVDVFVGGTPAAFIDAAAEAMWGYEIEVNCAVGEGPGEATFLCPDLSEEYVTLNAEVST